MLKGILQSAATYFCNVTALAVGTESSNKAAAVFLVELALFGALMSSKRDFSGEASTGSKFQRCRRLEELLHQ